MDVKLMMMMMMMMMMMNPMDRYLPEGDIIEINLVNVTKGRLSILCCWEAAVQLVINRGRKTLMMMMMIPN